MDTREENRSDLKSVKKEDWQALDFLLEKVERGGIREQRLLENETFQFMLSCIRSDSDSFWEIPHYIRASKIVIGYCHLEKRKSKYENEWFLLDTIKKCCLRYLWSEACTCNSEDKQKLTNEIPNLIRRYREDLNEKCLNEFGKNCEQIICN